MCWRFDQRISLSVAWTLKKNQVDDCPSSTQLNWPHYVSNFLQYALYSPWLKFSTFKRLSWLWRYRARIFKCVVLWCRFQTKIQTNLTQGIYFKVLVCNSEKAILLPSPSSHQSKKKKKRKPSSLSQRILFPLEGQRKHFSSLSLGLDLELAFKNPPHTYLLLKTPKAKTEPEVCRPQTKGNLSIGSNQHSKFHPDVRHAGLGIYKIFRCYNRDDAGTRS